MLKRDGYRGDVNGAQTTIAPGSQGAGTPTATQGPFPTDTGDVNPSDTPAIGNATNGGAPNAGVIIGALLGSLAGLVGTLSDMTPLEEFADPQIGIAGVVLPSRISKAQAGRGQTCAVGRSESFAEHEERGSPRHHCRQAALCVS